MTSPEEQGKFSGTEYTASASKCRYKSSRCISPSKAVKPATPPRSRVTLKAWRTFRFVSLSGQKWILKETLSLQRFWSLISRKGWSLVFVLPRGRFQSDFTPGGAIKKTPRCPTGGNSQGRKETVALTRRALRSRCSRVQRVRCCREGGCPPVWRPTGDTIRSGIYEHLMMETNMLTHGNALIVLQLDNVAHLNILPFLVLQA